MQKMNSNEIMCNGNSALSGSDHSLKKSSQKAANWAPAANLNWLIYMSFARGDFKYCKDVINHQFEATYDYEYLYYMQGLIARAEGQNQESLKFLQKAIELDPSNPNTLKEIGKTLYALQRWKQALEVFMKIDKISQRPDNDICYFIGELLYRNYSKIRPKAVDEAKEYFQRAIQNGKQLESYNQLAQIYKAENNLSKAIEMLENTLQISTDNLETLTEIGILYLRVNNTKGAFDKFFEVTKLNPNDSKALLALGSILQSKGDMDGALNKYKYIDEAGQKGAEIWSNVGLCFFKKKKFIASISCLKKALWIEPTNFNCLYNLGLVYLTAQQYASAFHALAAAVCIRTDFAECYMLLGICLKHLNDHGNAYLAFERSVMLPDAIKNPLIYLNFAVYCWRTKRFEQASANLDNFFNLTSSMNVKHELKNLGNKLKQFLPPAIEADSDTAISVTAQITTGHLGGAGETMAEQPDDDRLI